MRIRMGRRRFLAGLGALLAFPLAAASQPAGKVPRVGVLHPGSSHTPSTEAFRQGLRDLGYVEGRTIALEWRWAEGKSERFGILATELVQLGVDVIVAAHTQTALAAKGAASMVPIVMAASSDPVAVGLVASLGRPGGNVTGVSLMIPELVGKRLELLREAIPGLVRVAVMYVPEQDAVLLMKHHEAAGRVLGLESLALKVHGGGDLDGAFREASQKRAGAIVAAQNPLFAIHRARLAQLALTHRLPTVSGEPGFAEAGGLMTYGPSLPESWRRAAVYVDRILKGARPADLPVEQPTKVDLVINLKTARAIGLTIPHSLLLRADQVIE